MKRAIFAVFVIATTADAAPPPGWTAQPAELAKVGHFGMQNATSETARFMPPGASPGIELIVTRATTAIGDADRGAAIRAEVDELHAMSQRATLTGSDVGEDNWQEHANPATHVIEADLSWRDGSANLVETARVVIAGDARQLAATTGECIAREDADAALIVACKAALGTLDPGIDPKSRVALALVPAGTAAPMGTTPVGPAPQLTEGSHTPLPPITVPHDAPPPPDRRPFVVGAGLLALAAVFWWNTRRRAALERAAQGDVPK